MEKILTYSEATEIKSLKGFTKEKNRILIWLANINKLLPYELQLSDTEIAILAEFLADKLEKKLILYTEKDIEKFIKIWQDKAGFWHGSFQDITIGGFSSKESLLKEFFKKFKERGLYFKKEIEIE